MILSFIVFIFHFRDCMVTSVVNSLTSFFSGFVIFTYLGYMAKYQDRKIENVAEQGSFIVCGISIFIYIQNYWDKTFRNLNLYFGLFQDLD